MSKFCGVQEKTIHRLLYSDQRIMGVMWFKLCAFLEIQGYHVIEWQALEESKRNYAELIAYGLVDADKLTKELGYVYPSQFFQLLRSSVQSKEKFEKLWTIWQQKREALEKAKQKAIDKCLIPVDVPLDLGDTKTTGHVFTERALRQAEGVLEVMSGLVKLLKGRPLEQLSREDLAEINPNAVDNIFQLIALISDVGKRLTESKE